MSFPTSTPAATTSFITRVTEMADGTSAIFNIGAGNGAVRVERPAVGLGWVVSALAFDYQQETVRTVATFAVLPGGDRAWTVSQSENGAPFGVELGTFRQLEAALGHAVDEAGTAAHYAA